MLPKIRWLSVLILRTDPRLVASPEATAPQGGIRFLREAFFIWESLTLRVLHLGN